MKPKVYFPFSLQSRQSYWDPSVLQELESQAQLLPAADASKPWVQVPADAQAIVIGWGVSGKMPRSVWADSTKLRSIHILGGSTQNIEQPIAALDKGITITNAAHEIAEGVAEETLALILAAQFDLVNQACHYRSTGQRMYTHESPPPRPNRSLTGKTIGLIGFGHVATQFADLLAPFHVRLLICDPYAKDQSIQKYGAARASLEELLTASDVVSVHAGWTRETEGMITRERLDLLKEDALLVCTARLPLFDQKALAERVRSGLRFVSDFVPFEESIWSDTQLAKLSNLISVSSYTSITDRTLLNMNRRIAEDMRRVFSGQTPVNNVTADWIRHTT